MYELMAVVARTVAGLGDAPDTPSAIEYDDEARSEFLQDYLEVLYLSIRCVCTLHTRSPS